MEYKNIEKSFSKNRNVLGEVVPLKTPYTIILDISDICNLKCNYCFRHDKSIEAEDYRKNRLMNWETFTLAVQQMKQFPSQFKRIALSNHGEPLCNRALPNMVRHIKQEGLMGSVEIHTNATLLDEKYIEELCASEIDRIVISIQGLNCEKYREICGIEIDFDNFYKMLQKLFSAKINTEIDIKVVEQAISNQEDVFYQMFSPIADKVFIERVVPLWEETDEQDGINKYGDRFGIQNCCPLIFYTLNVLPDGTIYPCSHIRPPFKLGNINDTSLIDAWRSFKKESFMKKMLLESRFVFAKCKNCYVPQNTVMTEKDSIDAYRMEILERMDCDNANNRSEQ